MKKYEKRKAVIGQSFLERYEMLKRADRVNKEIEILAPAGSYESLVAAVNAGADAVYVGGSRFGARAFAQNFDEEELKRAIDYVHIHKKKIYLTVNTLVKEKEIADFYDYLLPYYLHGIDAVIVQDIGVLKLIKTYFPEVEIHISTQMTITGSEGAKYVEELGASRVVPARELSLQEIKKIHQTTSLEIECFVHGALCYSYSGQCLFSSIVGGRSGNRGQCAQPCRLAYQDDEKKKQAYWLSLKDICTLESIPQLIQAGITSFKIEGRMKRPEYVASVTSMYRKYLDLYLNSPKAAYKVAEEDKQMLMDVYNRGGFHQGYYQHKNGKDMLAKTRPNHSGIPALEIEKRNGNTYFARAMVDLREGDLLEITNTKTSVTVKKTVQKGEMYEFVQKANILKIGCILSRIKNETLLSALKEQYISHKNKEKLNGKLTILKGNPVILMLSDGESMCVVKGEPVQGAINQPLTKEAAEKQICKMGNTEFLLERLEIEMDTDIFLTPKQLNELRRNALEQLESAILQKYHREQTWYFEPMATVKESKERLHKTYAVVETLEQLNVLNQTEMIQRIYIDSKIVYDAQFDIQTWFIDNKNPKKEYFLALPYIFREENQAVFQQMEYVIQMPAFDGMLIRNWGEYQLLKEHSYKGKIVTDFNMYIWNTYAKEMLKALEIESFCTPLELNEHELLNLGIEKAELFVYGYIPMMISVQETPNLTDRYQNHFQTKSYQEYGYDIIYNSLPVALFDCQESIKKLAPRALRLSFSTESEIECKEVLKQYANMFHISLESPEKGAFTRGHFKRGVK